MISVCSKGLETKTEIVRRGGRRAECLCSRAERWPALAFGDVGELHFDDLRMPL